MINYSFPLYRTHKANNIIIQATLGYSHNRCSICNIYKSKRYTIRLFEDITKEIELLSHYYPNANKVFLADGDTLSLPTDHLAELLRLLKKTFLRLSRVSPCTIKHK